MNKQTRTFFLLICLILSVFMVPSNVHAVEQYGLNTINSVALKPNEKIDFNVTGVTDPQNINFTTDNSNPAIASIVYNGSSFTVQATAQYGSTTIVGNYTDPQSTVHKITIIVNVLEGIAFSGSDLEIDIEETVSIPTDYPVVTNPLAPNVELSLTYSSSNPAVAVVSNTGAVTGLTEGTATITASYMNKFSAKMTVVVVNKPDFRFTQDSLKMNLFSSVQAPFELSVHGGRDRSIIWESDKPELVSVDSNGWIMAKGVGDAVIKATVLNQTYVLPVSVISGVTDFKVEETNVWLEVGFEYQLNWSIKPDNQNQYGVTWSSSKPSVATVRAGLITAHSAGTAIIYGKVDNIIREIKVDVLIPIESISVTPKAITLSQDESQLISVIYKPSNTTVAKDPKFTSTDPSIATVSADGMVTGENPGTTTILVEDHDFTLTVEVTVTLKNDTSGNDTLVGNFVDVDTITFDTTNVIELSKTILEIPYQEAFNALDTITLRVNLSEELLQNNELLAHSLILNRSYLGKNVVIIVSNSQNELIYSVHLNNFQMRNQNIFISVSPKSNLTKNDCQLHLPFNVNTDNQLVINCAKEYNDEQLYLYRFSSSNRLSLTEMTVSKNPDDSKMLSLTELSSGKYLISTQNSDMMRRDWTIYLVSGGAILGVLGFVVYKTLDMRKKDKAKKNEEYNIM